MNIRKPSIQSEFEGFSFSCQKLIFQGTWSPSEFLHPCGFILEQNGNYQTKRQLPNKTAITKQNGNLHTNWQFAY
jgi:hypothetical protein